MTRSVSAWDPRSRFTADSNSAVAQAVSPNARRLTRGGCARRRYPAQARKPAGGIPSPWQLARLHVRLAGQGQHWESCGASFSAGSSCLHGALALILLEQNGDQQLACVDIAGIAVEELLICPWACCGASS